MIKSILVPLDGSEVAEGILPSVISLAQQVKARLHLLQVIPEPPGLGTGVEMGVLPGEKLKTVTDLVESWVEVGKRYLNKQAEKLKEKGIEVDWVVKTGFVVDTIIKYAKEKNVDLIALSTSGKSGIVRLALGSIAEKVIRLSEVPVLVIRPK